MTKDEFFYQIDLILGEQLPGKTLGYGRWRRGAGGGRYPNIGLIRFYSINKIHVLFHTPSYSKVFVDPDLAIKEISSLMTKINQKS